MDPSTLKILQGAAGAAGDSAIGVEDVFKPYIYTGTGSARSVTTGIDMTDGAMLWIKERGANHSSQIMDTERGAAKGFTTDSANDESNLPNRLTSFNSNGFSVGTENNVNQNTNIYCSWSFKKQKKFFDIVTYTGDGNSDRQISHGINGTVGCMMIKNRSDDSTGWVVYHRGVASSHGRPLTLNSDAVPPTPDWSTNSASWFEHTAPADNEFTVGNNDRVNKNGSEFVCYLFGDSTIDHTSEPMNVFGPNEDQHIIDCGQIANVNASSGQTVTLDFEPQWLLIKSYSHTGDWILIDSLRGAPSGGNDSYFKANTWYAEITTSDAVTLLPNGFKIEAGYPGLANDNTTDLCYIAIAAETGKTMKAITTGTDVFTMDTGNSSSTIPTFDSGFTVDMALRREPASSMSFWLSTRLQGPKDLGTAATYNGSESTDATSYTWDSNEGWASQSGWGSSQQSWMWKRHAGFDVVTYDGTGSARTQSHSLGVVPEMIWVKCRSNATNWTVYHKGLDNGSSPEEKVIYLDTNSYQQNASVWAWNGTAPTSSVFSLGTDGYVNSSSRTYVALLFSSVTGVSAVGSYTGNGTVGHEITGLGFQPRFIIIKNIDVTSTDWILFDTTRGWGSGNDNLLAPNTDAAQVNYDYGAPISDGFRLDWTGNYGNSDGDKFIYYAHA